jgi:hypothetical protein
VFADVHLAGVQPRDQVIRRQVNQLDIVCLVEHVIGQRLALAHPRGLQHQIVETLQVLNVDRGPHRDAGLEQLCDVLPALGMSRRRLCARQIGMSQLIDQQDLGFAGKGRVQIEFQPLDAAIAQHQRCKTRQTLQKALGVDTPMRLNVTDHHIRATGEQVVRGFQHCVGLTNTGRGAEEDSQPTTPLARHLGVHPLEQLLGIGPGVGHDCHFTLSASSARFSSSTLIRGSPMTPSNLPSVRAAINACTAATGMPRARATRSAW